jgi:DNA-binding protein
MTEEVREEKKKIEENVILVGEKPLFAYCNAVKTVVEKHKTAIIRTRGKFINKAINIAEISKRQSNLIEVPNGIRIGSQIFKNEEGKDITVSTFEVELKKK